SELDPMTERKKSVSLVGSTSRNEPASHFTPWIRVTKTSRINSSNFVPLAVASRKDSREATLTHVTAILAAGNISPTLDAEVESIPIGVASKTVIISLFSSSEFDKTILRLYKYRNIVEFYYSHLRNW